MWVANLPCNIAKGRGVELYIRVKTNDPSTSVLWALLLSQTGLEDDSVLIDAPTFADMISGTTNELTGTGYARVTLTDSDLASYTPDYVNDWGLIDTPNISFGSVAAGDNPGKLVFGYDRLGTLVAANMVPIAVFDYVLTSNGTDMGANVSGIFRAI